MVNTNNQMLDDLTPYLNRVCKARKGFSGAQVAVYSEKNSIDWQYANGISSRNGQLMTTTPYHVASIGKLFTASIVYQMAESGLIHLEEPIVGYLDRSQLGNLFITRGTDYTESVTFTHLLSHTSGVADYFEGPVKTGKKMDKWLKEAPDKTWQPLELVQFSIDHQEPYGPPGESYHYSDTGYVLLGLLIEAVLKCSFEEALVERILNPIGMKDTHMTMRSKPLSGVLTPIADIWLGKMEYGGNKALSVDWTGGGLITTLDDLMKFSIALHGGMVISQESLSMLFSGANRFRKGIYTGAGGMTVRFKELFPLLKLSPVHGHIGILATHVFYDGVTDTHIVINFGATKKMTASFQVLIKILSVISKHQ